jgi:hypothetical protein
MGNQDQGVTEPVHDSASTTDLLQLWNVGPAHRPQRISQWGITLNDSQYWHEYVRHRVLGAIGIHELGEEARRRMQRQPSEMAPTQVPLTASR